MLTVLAQDDAYVAIAKPPGRIVVQGRGSAANEIPIRHELEEQLGRRLLVVHRLDRGTSGALLFATDADSHRALSQAFERHQVVKHYWALVRGRLLGSGEVDLPLVGIRGGMVRAGRPGEMGGKPSRTAWRAVERIGNYTIVDFRPATGRLHQIRAHAAALGHPLAVDPDYGGAARLTVNDVTTERARDEPAADPTAPPILERTPLHALSIKFTDPRSRRSIVVDAPLAEDLVVGVARLRRAVGDPHPA
ncbi:MAG: RluA family pseudouridine synthase [Deltaproteobacteria bacterium]|nr:RluA family pseudouridine synthase [Deltaproteobacteria bacterium]